MSEINNGVGLMMCYQIAVVETVMLHQKFVTPDLLFNGITKIQDFLSSDNLQKAGLPSHLIPQFQTEAKQILDLFGRYNIDPRQARRKLREQIGDGGYERSDPRESIHRSDESRKAFDRATEIASGANASYVALQHLLAALLEVENTGVRKLLSDLGGDTDKLHDEAAALPVALVPAEDLTTDFFVQYGTDLTQEARDGKLSPTIGRKREMMEVIRTLSRERKNNPVLVGEAGVGKTAIVEGLAQRIVNGNIHPDFHNKRIVQINASDLVVDTKYRGDFEKKMQSILANVREFDDVILFIDEIHMLVGAGSANGAMDAANILKPALARGEIRLIGATTNKDYQKYIAKDSALERRFQPIRVEEPSQQETYEILAGLKEHLQNHHGVVIQDDAMWAAVRLSVRYLPNRRLPDKAHDLLDEACAWARYGSNISFDGSTDVGQKVMKLVTIGTVEEVTAEKSGVPIGQVKSQEAEHITGMREALKKRIVAQDEAIDAVVNAVQRKYAGLHEGSRPVGVFLFLGPTGVGKTELAKATAEFLFGSEERIIRLNMSEFMEKHNVARLIGSPPGYVGYEEGGQFTEALRSSPYSVVLLDEIEKAHPDLLNIFLQVFGDGRLTDGQGRTVDASNAIFVMTSNLGYQLFSPSAKDQQANAADHHHTMPIKEEIQKAVYEYFRPEFLNRIDDLVYFCALDKENIAGVVQIQLIKLKELLAERQIQLNWKSDVVIWLANQGFDPTQGARSIIRLIDAEVKKPLGGLLLDGLLKPTHLVEITLIDDRLRIEYISPDTI